MQKTELKKPTGVYVLAVLFLIAPIGNLLLSFAGSGIKNFSQPSLIYAFLQGVSPLDWFWLSLLVVTGILLLRPHKTSWTMAIVTLLLVLGINIYRAVTGGLGEVQYAHWQILFSSMATCAVLIMSFYFRFPYLDRRTRWFIPAAQRYDVRTPIEVVAQDIFSGVTESVSISGARVRLQRDMGPIIKQIRYVDVIFPEIKNVKIKTQVVEYDDNILRLKFKELRGKELNYLRDWLRSQDETNADNPG
ncbi:PilZ domain-containing protein [Bdellovibrio svalbardensis]|uniref:PilZ domain-containing protein n=1 Tax=Bdellovibrio svalbardensis TaxID=2972972 RepID=A0ABT6DI88_9BACT|nr:PilZ domain-containing protein [Bdellovibrio svalbardensis]MDG0816562.1 PilZ domain-containing protein [Bdellovibrio svalbardensis]